MTGIKLEGFGAVDNLLSKLPEDVRAHVESLVGEPVRRRELIDVIHAQMKMNIALLTTVVAVAQGDRPRMADELQELVKTIEGGSNVMTDVIAHLMSDDLFRAELGDKE